MTLYAGGVDVGSTQTKAVILEENHSIASSALIPTGANVTVAAEKAFQICLDQARLNRKGISYVIGTGYGRYKVTFGDAQITEISCHARGAQFLFPKTRTVIDMGGQDTKGIKIDDLGNVLDFVMNDKCAAGTGRFLQAAAEVVGLPLDQIGDVALRAKNPVRLSSVCAVFVESDIMSYLAQNKTVEDILGGVHSAIAARTISLIRRVGVEQEVTFSGGVSRNPGMIHGLEEKLNCKLNVSEQSHFAGAIGAALFALERAEKFSFEGQPNPEEW
jgi:predicted CoA-substrate-specific enzyme activase